MRVRSVFANVRTIEVRLIQLDSPPIEAWAAFVDGKLDAIESQHLSQSWSRSLNAGVPFRGELDAFVDAGALEDRRAAQDELRFHSLEVVNELSELLSRSGYVAILADENGVVLDRRGGGKFLNAAQQAHLVEGALWAESTRGTNAIGTALVERAEVTVHGRAHLNHANHGLICYATPLFDPDGRLRGVLDLTSHADAATPLALAALKAAAKRVQERWYLDLGEHLRPFESIVRRCAESMVLVDLAGRIRVMNNAMRERAGADAANFQALTGMTLDVLSARVRRGAGYANGEGLLELGVELCIDWITNDRDERSAALVTLPQQLASISVPAEMPVDAFSRLYGTDTTLRDTIERAEQLAATELPIVLLADTGTGKELLSRGIHDASPRQKRPFIAVNCAGFTDSLLQSELFGYGDGAFTGATRGGRQGLIEAADGGTLFLDEIADLPSRAQASLLRFLESGTFNRVGETTTRSANVRLISATCRNLPLAVERGEFRKDLFYRIKGAALTLPALSERDDVVYLAELLLSELARRQGGVCPRLTAEARLAIERHSWPGNVRELKLALQVALAMAGPSLRIELHHLPPDVCETEVDADHETGDKVARETRALLDSVGGNVSEAARILGVARSTIYRRLGTCT